eukprot:TRINITY_DN93677_c0_g1_i1.p1 TRINITY_DN93677_c0_g1~~TRINITY_DN93677_c0_g1_i1.p1  ORF type:complete len:357 (-),score=54.98 TRINITY_DN93677_c0_g1_i1:192-1262(-)
MCFLIGATGPGVTSSGEAFLGSVSDDPYLFRSFLTANLGSCQPFIGAELRYVPAKRAITGIDGQEDLPPPFHWEQGQPGRGVNAAGLAFTVALAIEQDSKTDGMPFAECCHRIMECSSVDEAVGVLQKAGKVTPAFTVLFADAGGDLAQVEVGGFGCIVQQRFSKAKPGVVLAVNCYQSEALSHFNKPEAQASCCENNNSTRLRRGWELVELHKKHIDVPVLAQILSDHQYREMDCGKNPLIPWWGYSICNHGTRSMSLYDATLPPWGTVSAEILQPSCQTFYYCFGWPCGEQAKYSDQLLQDNSWGKFVAFSLQKPGLYERIGREIVECTTVDGDITDEGELLRSLHMDSHHMGA